MSATFGKGSRQKKKRCVKPTAYPCKFACINKEKTCRNGLEGQAKTWALWLQDREERLAAVNAHRANKGRSQFSLQQGDPRKLSVKPTKNGALAQFTKKRVPETSNRDRLIPSNASNQERANTPRFKGDRQAIIDQKYTSEDPTSKDVASWREETIKNLARPEALEAIVASGTLFESFPVAKYTAPYMDKVRDEASFIEAYVALKAIEDRKRKIVKDDKIYTGEDIRYWQAQMIPFPEEVKKYTQAIKVLENPQKTDTQKTKAQKEVDKYNANLQRLDSLAQKHHQDFIRRQTDKNYVRNLAKEDWNKWSPDVRNDAIDAIRQFNTRGRTSTDKENRQEGRDWLNHHVERMVAPDHYFGQGTSPEDAIRIRLMSKTRAGVLGNPQTKAELKRAFIAFSKTNHPDRGGDTALYQSVSAQYRELLKDFD